MFVELRHALRSLRRAPVLALTAVITLALGVGGTTAIFSLVHSVLLKPLPFDDPDRLVRISETEPTSQQTRQLIAPATFNAWRQQARSLDLAVFRADTEPTVLGTGSAPVQAIQGEAAPNLFALLGTRPLAGREFGAVSGSRRPLQGGTEIVLTHLLARRLFGNETSAIGQPVRVEAAPHSVIVGVLPPEFPFPSRAEFWVPIDVTAVTGASAEQPSYEVVGRLKTGYGLSAARAELQAIAAAVDPREYRIGITLLQESIVGAHRRGLLALVAAVVFVMLVGCANVSNLLLARGLSRGNELAVRTALGASRARLMRMLLAEALLLALFGGVLGWAIARGMVPILIEIAAPHVPRLPDATVSLAMLAYCAAATAAGAVLAGLLPALRLSRQGVHAALGAGHARLSLSRDDVQVQRVLLAGELAICLMLIVGALLFVRTFVHLRTVELGFNPQHVVSIDARLPIYRTLGPTRYHLLASDATAVLARLRSLPGVQAVSATSDVPLAGNQIRTEIELPGEPGTRQAVYHRVTPEYFRTVDMKLVEGRDFTHADASDLARLPDIRTAKFRDGVVIVNETAARAFWPSKPALGQFLSTSFDARISRRRVVGVVRDARSETLRGGAPAEVYVPYLEDPSFAMTILVRTTLSADHVVAALRREVQAVAPDMSTANIRMLEDIVVNSMGSSRWGAFIVSTFAAVALMLSAIGVFGVSAFSASSRFREIGIRMALGATERDITSLFLRQSAATLCAGVIVGVGGALVLGQLVRSLLFGVDAADPWSFIAAAMLLTATALSAAYLPVRRIVRRNPVSALRA